MGWQHRQPDNRKRKKKKLWVRGVTWQEEGQSNFLYFVTWNLQGIYDRNCRPRRHGGLSLCLRQIFISPIWGWCKQEIFLLIISVRELKKKKELFDWDTSIWTCAIAQRRPHSDVMHLETLCIWMIRPGLYRRLHSLCYNTELRHYWSYRIVIISHFSSFSADENNSSSWLLVPEWCLTSQLLTWSCPLHK